MTAAARGSKFNMRRNSKPKSKALPTPCDASASWTVSSSGRFSLPPREYHYRRRIRLRCDKAKRIGFFRAFSHDLVEVDSCLIADGRLNKVIHPLRTWINELDTRVEHAEIVTGDDPNEVVAAGKIAGEFISRDDSACERLIDQGSGINGLILYAETWRKEWGRTAVSIRSDDGICLMVEGDVFTQINAEGNRELLRSFWPAAA